MRAYTLRLYQASQAASKTLGTLSQPATALKRISIQYCEIGSNASADNQEEFWLQRTTAAGTSTAVTPQLRDPADGAASAVAGQAHTVEPTYTSNAIMLSAFFHQRSTFQWYATPGHDIIIPLTNNAGIGIFAEAMGASANMGAVLEFEE
ncbi:MAG: hypothetical protein KGJ07_06465 [Patescibacteria group bacterium]|nr:hypothetical protein [Patescibacteria group bacterium]